MKSYSKDDIVLVRYPFTDGTDFKIRPAIVVNAPHPSPDLFIIPLTSKTTFLIPGEFILKDWKTEGLNVLTTVKRGIYTIDETLVIKSIGKLSYQDSEMLGKSLTDWFGI